MRRIVLAASALVLLNGAAGAACLARDAVYAIAAPERDAGEARLAPLEHPQTYSDLGLVISDPANGRSWRFTFTASNGYSMNYILPDPPDEIAFPNALHVFFFREDKAGRLVPVDIPQAGDVAPDALFMPELAVSLWYETSGEKNRTALRTGLWYRSSCR